MAMLRFPGHLGMWFAIVVVAVLAVMTGVAAGEDAQELGLDVVHRDTISSSEDGVQLVVLLPVDEATGLSAPVSVTAYAVNQFATTSLASRWPEVYLGQQPNPGPSSPNATMSTKSPEQSQVVQASAANFVSEQGVSFFRFFIGVWCPDLAPGDTSDFTVSVSAVEDLMGDRWATDEDSGVFILEGSISSGLRHYFAAESLPPCEIVVQVCSAVDNTGNGNAIPMAFLFDRFTDVDQSSEDEGQWPTVSCEASYNSASVVTDPSTGADGYMQVCPLYVHFTATVSPATFALDVSYWWNYSPVIEGTLYYSISVQTLKQVQIPAAAVDGYANAQVAGFEMRQDGADLIVDFVPLKASDGQGDVDDMDRATYAVMSDKISDELYREQLQFSHLFDSGCFLFNNGAYAVTQWTSGASLNDSSTLVAHKSLTAVGFFEDLTKPASVPIHVNIAVSSGEYGEFAYSMQVVSDTEDLQSPPSGIGGWAIFGIVVGSLSVLAVVAGAVGFVGFVLYKKKNSSYEVMN